MLKIPLAPPEELARRKKVKAELAALEKAPQPSEFGRASFMPMRETLRDVHGIAGVLALKPTGKQDTPSATFNTTDKPVAFITIKMPAQSVAVHPPPVGGVAAVYEVKTPATVNFAAQADGCGSELRRWHRVSAGSSIRRCGDDPGFGDDR